MLSKLGVFFKESRQELKHVNWPTKKETARYTLFVIGLSLASSVFLGVLDFIFLRLLDTFVI
ncbi:MAG: preprotein translocase subunit SecE [bacterium]|nr:preprotein translocase subunit SecE [bacterium]